MADIIALDERRKINDQERQKTIAETKRHIADWVLRAVTSDALCQRCGRPIERLQTAKSEAKSISSLYGFCHYCEDEYEAFVQQLKGQHDEDAYWRDRLWMDVWQQWIRFQSAVDQYAKSKSFKKLVRDIHQPSDKS